MDYIVPLTISLLALTLLLAGALVFLYLQALRQMRANAEAQTSFLAKTTEIALQQVKNAQDSLADQATTQETSLATLTAALTGETAATRTALVQATDLMLTRGLDGSLKAQERLSNLLQQATTLLGTKDPISFQQVYGGAAPLVESDVPYPATDEGFLEKVEKQRKDIADLDAAAVLLENLGVTNVGSSLGQYSGDSSF